MNSVSLKPEIDFRAIAAAALAQAEILVREWLPHGKLVGAEWTALNPTRNDQHAGSFKVSLTTGRWADFADDASGGDLISLFAYLNRLNQGQAARELAARLGMDGGLNSVQNASVTPKKPAWTPLLAVPGSAPEPPAAHPKHGKPTAVWTYHDASGERLFYVYRFDPPRRAQGNHPANMVFVPGWRYGKVALASDDRAPAFVPLAPLAGADGCPGHGVRG